MPTFVKSEEWIRELDDARAVLHANMPLSSSAFDSSVSVIEATVVMTSIGDIIRGCVVSLNVPVVDATQLSDVILDELPGSSYNGGSGGSVVPTPSGFEPTEDKEDPPEDPSEPEDPPQPPEDPPEPEPGDPGDPEDPANLPIDPTIPVVPGEFP